MEQSEAKLHSNPFINPRIYLGATKGDLLKHFNLDQCLDSKTPGGDNALHIAARFGHCEIIQQALNGLHQLLFDLNSKGQTPLHIAADNGRLRVVELLWECNRAADDDGVENGDGDRSEKLRSWRVKADKKGDTALHKALRNRHQRVGLLLLELDEDLAAVVNHDRESPLYLAAESRCDLVLQKILELGENVYSVSGPFGQNPLHAAAKVSYFATKCLVERQPDLIDQADISSKTAVHYAAERGHGDILKPLLKHKPEVACLYDRDGFTPLHRAAMAGSYYTTKIILNFCPQAIEFRDRKDGKTALHLAKIRNRNSLRRCLNNIDIIHMINEPDNDGNTPLHLAVMESDQEKVFALLLSNSISCRIRNNNHHTPMDLCRAADEQNSSDKNKIRLALETQEKAWCSEAQIDRPRQVKIFKMITFSTNPDLTIENASRQSKDPVEEQFRQIKEKDLKDTMNNMALIATLIATITFTAAFTVPGGYDSNNGNIILIKKAAFQVFYVSNIMAVLVSLFVMVSYNYNFVVNGGGNLPMIAGRMARNVTWCIALTAVAFLSGVFVVASDDEVWIAILACIVGFHYIGYPLLIGCGWIIRQHTSLAQVASATRDGIHSARGWGYFSRKWFWCT